MTYQPNNARVWYGHGLRTMPDGTDPADTDGDGFFDLRDERNEIATNWILCRQALLLAGESATA